MTQYDDGQDDIAALTFSQFGQASPDGDDDLQALVFSAHSDSAQESTIDDLRAWAPPHTEDVAIEGDAIRAQVNVVDDTDVDDENDENNASRHLARVTNPSRTVTVVAQMDGCIQQLALSPKLASMTESALADEILTIAGVACQKGLALQRAMVSEFMAGLAVGGDLNDDVVTQALEELPTPEQAEASQAEVFAARYEADAD